MTQSSPSTATSVAHPLGLRAAVVVLVPGRSDLRVAALTVLDRLVVALHRAGCESITVVGEGEVPPTPRAHARGITFQVARNMPVVSGPVLVVRGEVLVQVSDLKRLVMDGGRLVGTAGERFPVGVVEALSAEGTLAWDGLPERAAEGVMKWVRNGEEARVASRALWASLTSSSDGWVDRVFNRPVGRPLARWLSRTWITPNQISLASIVLGVVAGGMFAVGRHEWGVAAAILFQVSAILDCVDGDVARIVFKESPLGKWLDLVGDQVVHVSVFAGIAAGLARAGTSAPVGWLGVAAVAGALMSFVMVLRGMKRSRQAGSDGLLQRMLDAATNRDFSVLVLMLAFANLLEVFLWLAAVGSHVFWLLLWGLERRPGVGATRGVS